MIIKSVCCGKKMLYDNNYFNNQDYQSLTCLKCGCFKTIVTGTLDEEEIKNLKELNGEGEK